LIKNDQHCDFLRSLRAGTPGFIAPEILKNNIFDEKCDLFSFGCLIYMLFSGQQLFGCIPDR
jgi:serine/threonine protein kinase